MSREAEVQRTTRVVEDGAHGVDVVSDPGGKANVTSSLYQPAGVDSVPLRGDFVQLVDTLGMGAESAVGFADCRQAGKANPGEIRLYARDANGAAVGEVWCKSDGAIVASNAGGTVTLSPTGVLSIGGSSDAAALASVVDALVTAIKTATPGGPGVGETGLAAIQSALLDYTTSASAKLKVGG
jgi:hypothetical protein